MEPGIYPNLAEYEYHALPFVSASRLNKLKQSPAHCRYAMDNPDAGDKPALMLGRAIHSCVLTPELFASSYIVKPKFGRSKFDQELKEAWEARHAHLIAVDQSDMELCHTLKARLEEHKLSGPIFRAKDRVEISAIWIDSITSLACKLRSDALSEKLSLVIDLKTVADASPRLMAQSIFKWGWHRQGAFYLDGWRAHGFEFRHYCIIAVEKTPPYCIAVYRLTEDAIALGRRENSVLLKRYKECVISGSWPGYPEIIQDISIPAYGVKQIEEDCAYDAE